MTIVEKLMDKGENLTPEEEKLLKLLARLIEDFEQEYYLPEEAEPLEVLHHLMEARGVKPSQLWEVFGSKGIVFEVLNWKRSISKSPARALADYFHVPADLFVYEGRDLPRPQDLRPKPPLYCALAAASFGTTLDM